MRNFSACDADLVAELFIGRFAAKFLAHLQGNATHLGDFIDQVNRQTNRLALVGQGTLDRLLDPPGGVGAELSAFRRIETLDRFHQTDVSFRDQVEQRQAEVRVVMRDLYDQTQIRANHQRARFAVAPLDLRRQGNLLLRRQERDLPDLAQINFNSGIAIFSGHITFHEWVWGVESTNSRQFHVPVPRRSHFLTFYKVFNKVKYFASLTAPGCVVFKLFWPPM